MFVVFSGFVRKLLQKCKNRPLVFKRRDVSGGDKRILVVGADMVFQSACLPGLVSDSSSPWIYTIKELNSTLGTNFSKLPVTWSLLYAETLPCYHTPCTDCRIGWYCVNKQDVKFYTLHTLRDSWVTNEPDFGPRGPNPYLCLNELENVLRNPC